MKFFEVLGLITKALLESLFGIMPPARPVLADPYRGRPERYRQASERARAAAVALECPPARCALRLHD